MRTYGTLRLSGKTGGWVLDAEPHVHMRAKRVFAKLSKQAAGNLLLSDSYETCRDLEWFLDRYPLEMSAADRERLVLGATLHKDNVARLEALIDPNYEPPTFEMALPPRSYQAREAAVYLANGALLIGDDVGLGKTVAAITSFTDPRTLPAVVVTLTHLPRQWAAEIRTFAPHLRCHIVRKGQPYELPRFINMGPDVVILNYAKLAGWAKVLSAYAKSVVFDEIQELRHKGSSKYGAAEYLRQGVKFAMGLSATPIYNYGGEIFNILEILRPGCLGTHGEFLNEWCGETDAKGRSKLKNPKAFGTWAREQFLLIRHTRQDVGRELPDVVRVPQRIDADQAALDRVENTAAELARLILAQVETQRGQRWQASEQLSTLLRQATGIAKAPYVADFVRLLVESGERVVLCGWHREVYAIWMAKLKDLSPVMYTGTESDTQKESAKQAFIKGEAKILILSLRSGAGMNGLQEVSSCIVFGELDWSPGVHEQCLSRDTEVLTATGFRGVDDVEVGSMVAAFNPADGSVTFEAVESVVDRPLGESEQMYRIAGPSIDVRVTGGHRMVWREPRGAWRLAEAETVAARTVAWQMPVSGHIMLPDLPISDADLRFIAWVMSDGNVSEVARQLSISQSVDSDALGELEADITAAGFAYGTRDVASPTNYGPRRVPLRVFTFSTYVGGHGRRGWREIERYLYDRTWLWQLSERQFDLFIEVFHLANGNKQRGQSWTQRSYHITDDTTLLAQLQAIAVVRGWRASITPHRQSATTSVLHLKKTDFKSVARAGDLEKSRLIPDQQQPGECVWCVRNRVGTLIVRRNGKVAVVGNCIGRLNRDGQRSPVVAYFLVSESGADPAIAEVLGVKRQQVEGIRNPTQDFLEKLETDGAHARRLASMYLKQRGIGAEEVA